MMSRQKLFCAVFFAVTMATTNVRGSNHALEVCGDETGLNCLYTTNEQEFLDVPIQFDNELPSYLVGTLIRNGLGQFERGQQSVTHVFDGFAKLSSWRFFPNGTTVFSTRFIRSGFYNDSIKYDRLAPYMLFNPPDPPFSFAERQLCLAQGLDNMNINIWHFPEKHSDPDFAAFSDYWSVYEISGRNLATKRLIKPTLSGGKSMLHQNLLSSAHPLPEPGTTNRLTFLVRQRPVKFLNNRLSLVRMSSVSKRTLIAEWKLPDDVPYMHSFAVTQTKAILVTGPLVCGVKCLLEKASPLPCMVWNNDLKSKLYIVDLKSGKKKTIKMKSTLFAIHHINAYDVNDNEIIIDVVSYDSEEIVDGMLLMDTVLNRDKINKHCVLSVIRRVSVNHSAGTVTVQDMSTDSFIPDSLDMPAINENYRSKEYCYVYGISVKADGVEASETAIIKKDMCNGGTVVGKLLITGQIPVEPAFVADPAGSSEDDGVLLIPILRGQDAVTYLAVVDAKTMTITSKADLPTYLPFSLHGRFIKDFY